MFFGFFFLFVFLNFVFLNPVASCFNHTRRFSDTFNSKTQTASKRELAHCWFDFVFALISGLQQDHWVDVFLKRQFFQENILLT